MATRAPRNRTLLCTDDERRLLSQRVLRLEQRVARHEIEGRLVAGDIFDAAGFLPSAFVDLLVLDPPYNLTKNYNGARFKKVGSDQYRDWFKRLLDLLCPTLKPDATIYVCTDWRTSAIVHPVLESMFHVRNRITWEREKGRGAARNWKNSAEDIWFCTMSASYFFDVDAVKLKRKVLAPYRVGGKPKDWQEEDGGSFRLTHPSNIWTDLTVPFWSMPENTDHPTQKPEKLMAKIVLASSKVGDFVFDPFSGSGTTVVVAEKLRRRWLGVDIDVDYLCWSLKRLERAHSDKAIQGYANGVFWERNTSPELQGRHKSLAQPNLF